MKKILFVLSMLSVCIMSMGESKYFPVGTKWSEALFNGWFYSDPITYEVKDSELVNGIYYNVVHANGEPYCLLREEGPLVYMATLDASYEGVLYDFYWWEGKEYITDVTIMGEGKFSEVIEKIEDMVLEDGQTYQIWAPEVFYGDFIICGVGATNGIFRYSEPAVNGGAKTSLLEFTREVPIYNKENGTGLKEVGIDNRQKNTRPIRLKRNEIGGYDLQVKNSDGTWQKVK